MFSACCSLVQLPRPDWIYSDRVIRTDFSTGDSSMQAQAKSRTATVRPMQVAVIRRRQLERLIRERFGGSHTALSQVSGHSLSQIGQWLSGERNMGEKSARRIEQKCHLTQLSMDQEIGRSADKDLGSSTHPMIGGNVPLIEWSQIAHWLDGRLSMDTKTIPCVVPHGGKTFAVKVQGESMRSPEGRSFADGDIVFIDPDAAVEHGKFIAVLERGAESPTLRKLVIEGGKKYLVALNPTWPNRIASIDGAKIIGTVIYLGVAI